jgi:hypothetical protein
MAKANSTKSAALKKSASRQQVTRPVPLPEWLAQIAKAGESLAPSKRELLAVLAVDMVTGKYAPEPNPPEPTIEQQRDVLAHRLRNVHDQINESEISEVAAMLDAVKTLAYEFWSAQGTSERLSRLGTEVMIALSAIGAAGTAKLDAIYNTIDALRLYREADVSARDVAELQAAKAAQPEGGDDE